MTEIRAEIRLPTQELRNDLPFYTKVLKMRMDMIYPADNPEVAVLSGHGLRLRIEKGAKEAPGTLRILTENPDTFAAVSYTHLDVYKRQATALATTPIRRGSKGLGIR